MHQTYAPLLHYHPSQQPPYQTSYVPPAGHGGLYPQSPPLPLHSMQQPPSQLNVHTNGLPTLAIPNLLAQITQIPNLLLNLLSLIPNPHLAQQPAQMEHATSQMPGALPSYQHPHQLYPQFYDQNNYMLVQHQLSPQTAPPQMQASELAYLRPGSAIGLVERLQAELPEPPLAQAPVRPDQPSMPSKRIKRKSKFSEEQDLLIVSLKREGRPWVEIADIAGVDSYLAARNRYQVIVGQQGNNNSSSWTQEDRNLLQHLLDGAEIQKWDYIAKKLSQATGKPFDGIECRELVREMFWASPNLMGVGEETVAELQKRARWLDF